MGSEVSSPSKRNRDKESNLGDDHSSGVNDEHCEIAYSSQLEVDAGYTSNRNQGPDVLPYKASILSSCRAALVKSPAASRAALARHRGTVDPELIKILETIGSFKDEDGSTPLHECARRNDACTAQFLIIVGANVLAKDSGGATPLDLATDTGGACYSVLQSHTAEFIAIRKKPAAFVSMAVSHCASLNLPAGAPISKRAYLLNPPFLWAPSFARVLLFKWARGAAIIHIAGDTAPFASLPDDCAGDVLEYLEVAMTRTESLHVTEHCSSPKARDWVRAVLAAAVALNATAMLDRAATEGDLPTVRKCLQNGANVDAAEPMQGTTPLMLASDCGYIDIVELLLQAVADVDAKDMMDFTALTLASSRDYTDIMKLLLNAGADTEVVDKMDSFTALIRASVVNKHVEIVKLLLEAGAKTDTSNEDGLTALIKASECGSDGAVKLLLEAGANMEATEEFGQTALIKASQKEFNVRVVNLLLEAGAEKEAIDAYGDTALIKATIHGNFAIVKLLLEAGAKKDFKSRDGKSALKYAKERGYPKLVALLE